MSSQIEQSDQATVDLAVHTIGRLSHSELSGVDLLPSAGDTHWDIVLSRPLVVSFDNETHVVGAGFRFDGASVRYRAVHLLIDRYGRDILPAAALHDWYYSDGRHLIPEGVGDPRRWCDLLLYRGWRASGVSYARARPGYGVVRALGGRVWDRGEAAGFDRPSTTKETLRADGLLDYTGKG